MDPNKVNFKFKNSKSGKAVVAYCDAYPEISGTGPTEDQAVANFWKIFNGKQSQLEHEETLLRKEQDTKKAS